MVAYKTSIAHDVLNELSDSLAELDQVVIRETYDAEYFSRICNSDELENRYSRDDLRGFGDVDLPQSIGLLILLFKKVGLLIPVKIAADMAVSVVYSQALTVLKNLPIQDFERHEPWSTRLKDFLERKTSKK